MENETNNMNTQIPCPKCERANVAAPLNAVFPGACVCACGTRYTSATPNARDGVQSVVRNLIRTGRLMDNAYMVGAADMQLRRAVNGEQDDKNGWLVARLTDPERTRLGLAAVA